MKSCRCILCGHDMSAKERRLNHVHGINIPILIVDDNPNRYRSFNLECGFSNDSGWARLTFSRLCGDCRESILEFIGSSGINKHIEKMRGSRLNKEDA